MTLRQYLSTILDSIKTAIESIHVEISTTSYSGNSITFTSNVDDMPLDNISIEVQGYQEGTGTPDPVNNIRPIINYGSVDIDLNGDVDTIQLGDTFYTGKLYSNIGVFVATRGAYTTKSTDNFLVAAQGYIKPDACGCYITLPNGKFCPSAQPALQPSDLISSHFKFAKATIWASQGYPNTFTFNFNQLHFNIANALLGITDYTQETVTTASTKVNDWIHANPITVTFATSRIIQLTPAQLKSIKGINTISANTGSITANIVNAKLKSNI